MSTICFQANKIPKWYVASLRKARFGPIYVISPYWKEHCALWGRISKEQIDLFDPFVNAEYLFYTKQLLKNTCLTERLWRSKCNGVDLFIRKIK